MLVAIHQPHYLPWLGYLEKMAEADLFIVLDHVQFERGNYQNRTQVRVNGAAHWLTVPVVQRSQKERIDEKLIDTRQDWEATHYETLRRAYGQAAVAPLRPIYEMPWERLVDLNDAMLRFLRAALGIHTPLIYSSALGVTGAKSELVLNLCKAVGAGALLVGLGGSRHYLDRAAFAAAGIELVFQEFKHPVYPQRGPAPFIPGLSAVDFLFNKKTTREELSLAA
ncbi:MAG: WbqC family protein [Betaproteobacteria bacterium]|nr:WbqC family protein [Betaproteobacteria bacterium]MBV9361506.1 WbqC family protein [Betaproteobacteria bacterium]